MKLKIALTIFFSLFSYQSAFACSEPSVMDQLNSLETEKLLSNAPTFKHAWQDKAINVLFSDIKTEGDHCIATLEVNLAQKDLDEANQHLDQNPANRILIAAQGYAVPEAKAFVPVIYQVTNGKVDLINPNTPALKSLHNNIEYTYQLLAQLRIHVDENTTNTIAWSSSELDAATQACERNNASKSGDSNFCSCRSNNLSKAISQRQMELVNYIETQPFSVATGSMNGFRKLNEKISETCSVK